MSVPATTTDFIDLVLRSGLLDESALDRYLPGASGPQTPRELAAALVRDGHLTAFQAELLLQQVHRPVLLPFVFGHVQPKINIVQRCCFPGSRPAMMAAIVPIAWP